MTLTPTVEQLDHSVARSGREVLLELEDLANDLLHRTIYRNRFWKNLLDPQVMVPQSVLFGMCIENYHFLFRESYFDPPVLAFPASTPVRVLLNEFYHDELGHDELLLRSLNSIGITREQLLDTVPLRETMALCNALAYWSRWDPLFFLTTLGIMEGKDIAVDSYVVACQRHGLPESFTGPILAHAKINMSAEHGNLTRLAFRDIPAVDEATRQRFFAQTHLFVEIYDAFYAAVWDHYTTAPSLLRRVSGEG